MFAVLISLFFYLCDISCSVTLPSEHVDSGLLVSVSPSKAVATLLLCIGNNNWLFRKEGSFVVIPVLPSLSHLCIYLYLKKIHYNVLIIFLLCFTCHNDPVEIFFATIILRIHHSCLIMCCLLCHP